MEAEGQGNHDLRAAPAGVSVLDGVLPAELVEAAYEVFSALVMPPGFFYVTAASVSAHTASTALSAYLPGPASVFIERLLATILDHAPPRLLAAAGADAGFEVWLGVTAAKDDTAYLHVDNDEGLRRRGVLRSPVMGTIFHVGPAAGLAGGDTVFDMAGPDPTAPPFFLGPWPAVAARIARPLVVPQRAGRLVLFSGDLPHAVTPIASRDVVRVALLANLWVGRLSSVPEGVCAVAAEAFPGRAATPLRCAREP